MSSTKQASQIPTQSVEHDDRPKELDPRDRAAITDGLSDQSNMELLSKAGCATKRNRPKDGSSARASPAPESRPSC